MVERETRDRVVRAYLVQGAVGLLLAVAITWLRPDEPLAVLGTLGTSGVIVTAIFFLFGLTLSFLKFPLTEEIFVSFAMTSFIAMVPLLGPVLSVWLATSAVILNRLFDLAGIGAQPADRSDRMADAARTFGLFGTYGIPIVVASLAFEASGGTIPLLRPSAEAALQVSLCGVVMIVTNSLVMVRVQRAYGYRVSKMVRSTMTDIVILVLGIPFAFMVTFSYSAVGWLGVAALAFTGVLGNQVARNLALEKTANQKLVQRLSSLTNIGKSISISGTRDELLLSVYNECRRFVDAGIFTIYLVDAARGELSAELHVEDGQLRPPFRLPIGSGLNSWVVENGRPLLIRSASDELLRTVVPADDGLSTQSWLGVPMTVHERVIGTISVQSFRAEAFTDEDAILLTAVANQAAVAIENARLYQDLEGLYVALEERVEQRTAELRETNLRLIAADGTRSRFLAHMSHELRTPLNSIIGFSRILIEKLQADVPPRLYRFIENIHVSGSHLLTLINEILDLSKIDAGKMELKPARFRLDETINAVDRLVRGMAAEAQVAIVTTVDPAIGEVVLDEGRVKQILINLLANAVKFSPEGEFVHFRASRMEMDRSPLGVDSVCIEITDHGPGIVEGDLPHIFEEFYQAAPSGKTYTGTGLGLPLTKRFVDLHHGQIVASPGAERGSTFTVHLPVDVTERARLKARAGGA